MLNKTKAVTLKEKSYSDLGKKEKDHRYQPVLWHFRHHSASQQREGRKIWKIYGAP